MNTTTKTFGVIEFLSPGHSRHSALITDVEQAIARFTKAVDAAKADTTVKRVALYRFTGTKTECLDEWMRLGGRACKLRHETAPVAFTPAQAA